MLSHLTIRNFVLVDNISLDFSQGLSVITGESGAGKSIMINATALALGERGSPSMVREGADKAEISVVFDISHLKVAQKWLTNKELLNENDCIIRRIIVAAGGSRAFINGTPVTLEDIKEIGALMVSLQGQAAYQNLMNKKNHVAFVDDYGKIAEQVAEYRAAYSLLVTRQQELRQLKELGKHDERTLELLKHELDELEKHALSPDEYNQLEEEHNRLNNAGDLMEAVGSCLAILQEGGSHRDDGVGQDIMAQVHSLSSILTTAKDKKLIALSENVSQIEILLKDIKTELVSYQGLMDLDPGRLETINTTMSELYRLARKHNAMPGELQQLTAQRKEEWDNLSQLDKKLQHKEEEITEQLELSKKLAAELTNTRKKFIKGFNQEITDEMSKLQMSCRFATKFSYNDKLSPSGDSDVEFLLSTSPNGKLLPIKNIASGGELSRAALAITKIVAHNSAVPCLIFDEADSGIGGQTAARVGQSLAELGKNAQVISITHQPQTAVYGDNHYAVVKSYDGSESLSRIKLLNEDERLQEIARMVGGLSEAGEEGKTGDKGDSIEQDALNYASKLMNQARFNAN